MRHSKYQPLNKVISYFQWDQNKLSQISYPLIFGVTLLCLIPLFLEIGGVNFGTQSLEFKETLSPSSPTALDTMHYILAGSFVHTLLEWSAFCTGVFTAILALVHFTFNRDVVTPIIGVALFYAGCMDAFHTLAADRLIAGVADFNDLIPFTWAICRLFSAVIMIVGGGLFLIHQQKRLVSHFWTVAVMSLGSGILAYFTILICVRSDRLPQTLFPHHLLTRPWDIAPLILFLFAGLVIFPRLCQHYPSIFSQALLISVIPQIITQFHMAFRSEALFDSDFNVAHFLKIFAYFIPFLGLCLSYVNINRDKTRTVHQLQDTQNTLVQKNKELEYTNWALQNSELELQQKTDNLEITLQQLKNTQTQLIQNEKMSSLGQLVAGVAHEINNPVNFIHGNLIHAESYTKDLLELIELYQNFYPESYPEIEDKKENIEIDFIVQDFPKLMNSMLMGTTRIKEIVLSLRNFSRMDESDIKEVNLHEGIENSLIILQNRLKAKTDHPEITVIRDYGQLPLIECYAGQVNQVFMNILVNSIDALENCSKHQDKQWQPVITIHTQCQDKRVIIKIKDNAGGIPETIKNRIFDPFFTTKNVGQGTGLGLSISYKIIVEKHRGTLDCVSQPNQGTEFIITLPIKLESSEVSSHCA